MMQITFPVRIETAVIRFGSDKTVYYPQVVKVPNEQVVSKINRTILHETEKLIRKQRAEMPTEIVEIIGTYEVKNNQRNILSLLLSNYTYHLHAAHGMTYLTSLTFDLHDGHSYSLAELFLPESDYVTKLSQMINEQIKRRDIPTFEEYVTIKRDQDFYIADKTLVIYFQLYEITPYVYGFPMFPISIYDIQDIIDESEPLGKMLAQY